MVKTAQIFDKIPFRPEQIDLRAAKKNILSDLFREKQTVTSFF